MSEPDNYERAMKLSQMIIGQLTRAPQREAIQAALDAAYARGLAASQAEVERLRLDLQMSDACEASIARKLTVAEDERDAARAERDRLREALQYFAEFAGDEDCTAQFVAMARAALAGKAGA